jgi:hypothetical protein
MVARSARIGNAYSNILASSVLASSSLSGQLFLKLQQKQDTTAWMIT